MSSNQASRARHTARRHALRIRLRKPWIDDIDGSIWPQYRAEMKIVFKPPFDMLSIVIINAGLALGVWFLINPDLVWNNTGLIFLPFALASWALSDVPSTNLFGSRSEQIVERIDHPVQLRRIMTVENLALWTLVAPGCVLLALSLMPDDKKPMLSIAVAIAVMCGPFCYLGLGAIIAPLLPYHPLPWRERLNRPKSWPRWGSAILIAYFMLSIPASTIAYLPAIIMWKFVGKSDLHWLIAALILTPWCLFVWRVGLHISTWIAQRRKTWLVEFLADENRG